MSKAFVCINTITGSSAVVEDLRNINGVSEIHPSKGMYDVLAFVQAESLDELKEAVLPAIRKIDNVKSTLTMTILEG